MLLLVTVVIVSVGLLAGLPVWAQSKKAPAKSALEAEFKAMIAQYYEAWSTLDPDKAAKYYAKDADLIFYDIAPLKYNAWKEYREGVIKAFTETMSSGKLTPNDDLKVTARGNIVWTTVTFHLSAKPKAGGLLEVDARHTAIWEKRGGKWLIVHEHVSAPLPG
jgi:ketosteroid isomerase-like protein